METVLPGVVHADHPYYLFTRVENRVRVRPNLRVAMDAMLNIFSIRSTVPARSRPPVCRSRLPR